MKLDQAHAEEEGTFPLPDFIGTNAMRDEEIWSAKNNTENHSRNRMLTTEMGYMEQRKICTH